MRVWAKFFNRSKNKFSVRVASGQAPVELWHLVSQLRTRVRIEHELRELAGEQTPHSFALQVPTMRDVQRRQRGGLVDPAQARDGVAKGQL